MTIYVDESRRFLVVGDRRWPVEYVTAENTEVGDDTFRFRYTLVRCENGWGVGLGWGTANYGTNYCTLDDNFTEDVEEVEVGLWLRDQLVTDGRGEYEPAGWIGADVLNQIIIKVMTFGHELDAARPELDEWSPL